MIQFSHRGMARPDKASGLQPRIRRNGWIANTASTRPSLVALHSPRMSSATRGPAARVPAGRFAACPHRRRRTAICRKWQGLWRPAPSISPRFGRRTWVAGCRPARDRRRAAVTAFRASRSARIAIICRHSPAPSAIAAVGNSCLGSRTLRSSCIPIRPSGLQRRRRSLGADQSCLWPYRGAAASSDTRRRAKGLGSERSSRTRFRCGPKKE